LSLVNFGSIPNSRLSPWRADLSTSGTTDCEIILNTENGRWLRLNVVL